jgi:hypothetical protein
VKPELRRTGGEAARPSSETPAPAYYAPRTAGWPRDLWALLHPPYTAWHLSYVLIGAGLAPVLNLTRLVATLLAFFLAVGIAAHSLDELRGRPLRTQIPRAVLWVAAAAGLVGAVGLGVAGLRIVGAGLIPFILAGILFVFAYNLELFGGRLHGDFWFALSWGAFPVLTAYFAQTGRLSAGSVIVAAAAYALSYGQRALSTPARLLRRRTASIEGALTLSNGGRVALDGPTLLRPLERALSAFSYGVVLVSLGLVVSRLI